MLDFLEKGVNYEAQIYANAEDSKYDLNPESYQISTKDVQEGSELTIRLARGGGATIRFIKL